jgi:pilus assembly protein CpaC
MGNTAQAHRGRTVPRAITALILIVLVVGQSTVYAQLPARAVVATVAANEAAPPPVEQGADSVRLLVGRSVIVDVGKPIARVSLTSADVADALVTSPNELLVNGKMPGTISMFVWDRAGAIRRYEVHVQRDLARLSEQLKQLFPNESVEVRANGKTAVLSGTVSSKDVSEKIASLAGSFVDTKEELVSLLQVGESARSNMVLLRVRFAEVSRSAMTELGVGLFTSPTGVKNTIGRVTTQQFPAPTFDNLNSTKDSFDFGAPVTSASGKFTFSDFLNLFLFSNKYDLGAMVKALQNRGLFQSLAEPNLVAESGKEASFLAGGEFPIPVAQASGGGTSITVQFKEFGIRLSFTPVVNGNRIHLKVRPEVSALDFSNAVTLQGFRIPALSTRRTETEIELNDGQTFAIAGLLNNTMNSTLQKIPGIGDIPILGLLFKSKAAQKNQTELVVMITPEILRNNSPGVAPDLPRLAEPFLAPIPQKQVVAPPPPAFRPAAGARSETAVPTTTTAAIGVTPGTTAAATIATPAIPTPNTQDAVGTLSTGSPAKRSPNVHVDAAAATPETPSTEKVPAPATPDASMPPSNVPAAETSKPLTKRQEQALTRAQAEEQKAADRANAEEAKREAKRAEEDQRKQKIEQARQEKLAREQAVHDAAAAKLAEEAAKKQEMRDAEAAKKQAELDKKRQKAAIESENRFKAAEAAYQAELAKTQRP